MDFPTLVGIELAVPYLGGGVVHTHLRNVGCVISTPVLLLAITMSLDVLAQSPRLPWDRRPDICFGEFRAQDPACEQGFFETANHITLLYQNEQFALLDRAIAEAMDTDRRFADGRTPSDAVYWAFRQVMRAPGTDPAHREKIGRWQNAVPGSAFAVFAQARFAYGSAWNIRGNQYGNSVSKESWEIFHVRLREAEQVLLDAPKHLKDTPVWHRLLLAVSLEMPQPRNEPQKLFDEALKRWPRHFGFYELILTRMVPKWGGSWQHVDASISEWSNRLSATEGKSLYARLYVSLFSQATANEMAMDWEKMKVSFEDLITRYPSHAYKNTYASVACFARDKPAFASALNKVSREELDPSQWLAGHSYEACMRWAGI